MAVDPSTNRADLLAQLVEEERAVSASRRRLHDRIDFFAGAGDPESAEALRVRERELSARRRDLHDRIDALRRRVD